MEKVEVIKDCVDLTNSKGGPGLEQEKLKHEVSVGKQMMDSPLSLCLL